MTLRPLYAILIGCLIGALAFGIPYAGGLRAAYMGPDSFKAWTATIAVVLFIIAFWRTRPLKHKPVEEPRMTNDAKESLTALVAVSSFVGLFCLAMLLIPNDLEIPRWVVWIGFGVSSASLIGDIVRRRRKRA